MGTLRRHLTFANVVSVLALFAALGLGTAWALEKDSVRSRHIKDGQVRTGDVANDTGAHALTGEDIAVDTLTGGDIDESTLAGLDADSLDGLDSADFAPADAEDWHVLGTPGEPALDHPTGGLCSAGAWKNTDSGFDTAAAFYRDPYGVVHLKGTVDGGVNHRWCHIFQLPPGYRPGPDFGQTFPVLVTGASGDEIARLGVFGNTPDADEGGVTLFSGPASPTVVLDGVSFRCHPSGANGCP